MNDSGKRLPGSCRFEEDVVAFLQNELDPATAAGFKEHLRNCATCTEQLEAYRALMQELRNAPVDEPSRDLAPAVLARIESGEHAGIADRLRVLVTSPGFLRAAALFACLLAAGIFLAMHRPRTERSSAERIDAAIGWLCAAQEPDGHWDAAKWGAQKNYTPGITALAVLAILKQDPSALQGPHAETVFRGLEYLMTQQNRDGRIGAVTSGTPYNQGLAALALLEAIGREKNDRWRDAADRAVRYIQSTQLASGGWGYPRTAGDSGNTSITVWQLQALLKAEASGAADLRGSIDRGMAWLGGVVDRTGRIGYSRPEEFPNGHETLTAAGALCFLSDKGGAAPTPQLAQIVQALRDAAQNAADVDYYRFYFMTQALLASGSDSRELADRLREALAACQAQDGELAGSFETGDRWSSAGGRVYATAMAVLAM